MTFIFLDGRLLAITFGYDSRNAAIGILLDYDDYGVIRSSDRWFRSERF